MIISYCWLFVKIKLNNSKKIYFFALVLVIVYTDNGDAGKMYAAANAAQDENGQQRNKREKGRRREKTAKEKTAKEKTAEEKTAEEKTANEKTAKEKTAKEKTAPRLLRRGAVFLLIRCRRRPAARGCSTGLRTGLRRGAARGPIVPVPSARGISCPPSSQRSIRRAPPRPGADRAASRPDPPACPAECCRAYPAGRGSPHCCWSLP